MKKNISLSIPQPCHEKWETFTTTANGGFCSSCREVVVDFTTMSDDQIIEFINRKPANTCGRFSTDQLKMYVTGSPVKINPGTALLKAGFLGLLLAASSYPVLAQKLTEKTKMETVNQKNNPVVMSLNAEHTIKGKVISGDDGTPLAGVYIIWQGTSVGTITDEKGDFEFPQKLKEGDVLLFSFVGLQTEEYKVPKEAEGPFEIKMKMQFELMGKLAVDEIYTAEPSGMSRLWKKVKELF